MVNVELYRGITEKRSLDLTSKQDQLNKLKTAHQELKSLLSADIRFDKEDHAGRQIFLTSNPYAHSISYYNSAEIVPIDISKASNKTAIEEQVEKIIRLCFGIDGSPKTIPSGVPRTLNPTDSSNPAVNHFSSFPSSTSSALPNEGQTIEPSYNPASTSLEDEKREFQELNKQLQAKIGRLEDSIRELQAKIDRLQAVESDRQKAQTEQEKKITELKEKLETAQRKKEELEDQLKQTQDSKEGLERQSKELTATAKQNKQRLESQIAANQEAQRDLQARLERAQKNEESLKTKNKETIQEYDRILKRTKEKRQKTEKEAQKRIEKLEKKLNNIKKEAANKTSQLNNLKQEKKALNQKVLKLQKESKQLKKQLEDQKMANQKAQKDSLARIDKLNREKDAVRLASLAKDEEIDQLNSDKTKLDEQIEELKAQTAQAQKQLADQTKTQQAKEEALENQIQKLQAANQKEKKDLQTQIASLKETQQTTQNALSELEKENEALVNLYTKAKMAEEPLTKENTKLNNQLQILQEEKRLLEEQLKARNTTIREILPETSKIKAELANKNTQIQELQTQLNENRQHIEDLAQQNKKLQETSQNAQARLRQELEELLQKQTEENSTLRDLQDVAENINDSENEQLQSAIKAQKHYYQTVKDYINQDPTTIEIDFQNKVFINPPVTKVRRFKPQENLKIYTTTTPPRQKTAIATVWQYMPQKTANNPLFTTGQEITKKIILEKDKFDDRNQHIFQNWEDNFLKETHTKLKEMKTKLIKLTQNPTTPKEKYIGLLNSNPLRLSVINIQALLYLTNYALEKSELTQPNKERLERLQKETLKTKTILRLIISRLAI